MGLAFNLGGFIAGFLAKDGGLAYPIVHLVSVAPRIGIVRGERGAGLRGLFAVVRTRAA